MAQVPANNPAILFVTATRIGDAVLSTGLLRHLAERFPQARFTIVAGPVAAPLFRAAPGLERLIALPKRGFARHWLDLYARVALRRWDMVVDLRGSALSWLLLVRERHVAGKGPDDRHRVQHLANLFRLDPPPAPMLWTSPEHEAAALRLIPPGAPVLALGPTANWGGKTWRPENFVALIQRLTASGAAFDGARVAVLAAPHERAQAEPVLRAVAPGRLLDLTGEGDLLTVAASLRRADLFIGNDSGLMHMAAAAGTPTLGLFGPSRDAVYAPWGPRTAVARTRLSYDALISRPGFDFRDPRTQMDTLDVETVAAAADALARRGARAA